MKPSFNPALLAGSLAVLIIISAVAIGRTVPNFFADNYSADSQLAQTGGSGGNTYYVATTGDDANPGTQSQPWKTIERALNPTKTPHVVGGDTLYIRGGTYHFDPGLMSTSNGSVPQGQLSGTASQRTTIAGYPGENPVIYGSVPLTNGWQRYEGANGANIWYFNWDQHLAQNYPWAHANANHPNEGEVLRHVPQLVAIDGSQPRMLQEINSNKNAVVYSSSATAITWLESFGTDQNSMVLDTSTVPSSSNGTFYYERNESDPEFGKLFVWLPDGSDPNGKPIEVGHIPHVSFGNQSYLTIKDLSFRFGGIYGLGLHGSNNIIADINSSYNGVTGLVGTCISCVVEDSHFFHNGSTGSNFTGNGLTYDNNKFDADNNYRLYKNSLQCGGIKIGTGNYRGLTFRNNEFNQTKGNCIGLWLDTVQGGHLIENNTFKAPNFQWAVLSLELVRGSASDPTIVRNNTFDNAMMVIAATDHTFVEHNVFWRGRITVHGLVAVHPGPSRRETRYNTIRNNIFYLRGLGQPFGNDAAALSIVQEVPEIFSVEGNVSDYNIFITPSGARATFGAPNLRYDYPWSFDEWKTRGWDTHSLVLTETEAKLKNLAGKDFTPLAGSPAIDAGIASPHAGRDANGTARTIDGDGDGTVAPDIGLYEAPASNVRRLVTANPVVQNPLPDPQLSDPLIIDVLSPTISISSPSSATTISGSYTLRAQASDNVGVTRVQYFINGTSLSGDISTSPYSYSWNTINVSNGTYALTAKAWDARGNVTTSSPVNVTISNQPATIDTTPPHTSNVYVHSISSSRATVSWTTNEPATSQVEFGPTTAYGNTTSRDNNRTTNHQVTISGLRGNSIYHARAISRDAANNPGYSGNLSFTTLPEVTQAAQMPQNPPAQQQSPYYVPPSNYNGTYTTTYTPGYTPPSTPLQNSLGPLWTVSRTIKPVPTLKPTAITKNLVAGDKGAEVALLQETLFGLGYDATTTAIYDQATTRAVTAYQEDRRQTGLVATGKLDNATRVLLNSDVERLRALHEYEEEIVAGQENTASTTRPTGMRSIWEQIVGGFFILIEKLFL